jgi:hypothetical protein
MDYERILAELRRERNLLDGVIVTIEALARNGKRGRGRPLGSFMSKTEEDNGNHGSDSEKQRLNHKSAGKATNG